MKKKIVAIILLIAMLSVLSFVLAGCDEIISVTIDGKYKRNLHQVSTTKETKKFNVGSMEKVIVRFQDYATYGYHDFKIEVTSGAGITAKYGGKSYGLAKGESIEFSSKLTTSGNFDVGITGSPFASSTVKVTFMRGEVSARGSYPSESSGYCYYMKNTGSVDMVAIAGVNAQTRPYYYLYLTPAGVKSEYEKLTKNLDKDINEADYSALSDILDILLEVPDSVSLVLDTLRNMEEQEEDLLRDIKNQLESYATSIFSRNSYVVIRVYKIETTSIMGVQYKYKSEIDGGPRWDYKTFAPGFEGQCSAFSA